MMATDGPTPAPCDPAIFEEVADAVGHVGLGPQCLECGTPDCEESPSTQPGGSIVEGSQCGNSRHTPLCVMLDLSTAHIPWGVREGLDTGDIRVEETAHGWVVYVLGGDFVGEVPAWLRPIHDYARGAGAVLINFDTDGDRFPWLFPEYE